VDADHIEALLQASARAGEAMSYGAVLNAIGLNFSRPKMRALCKLLDDIDSRARGRGEPELAVLVVRASDGLPGQGWWVGGRPRRDGYTGAWEGPEAAAYVARVQRETFDYWRSR
jgi:hypothetical protein